MIKTILAATLLSLVPADSAVKQHDKEEWLQDLNKAMIASLERCTKRPNVKRCELSYQVHAVYDRKRVPTTLAHHSTSPKAIIVANSKPASAGLFLEERK